MTKLGCSISNCINNSENSCCRPDIEVGGKAACDCDQTCCSDFQKRSSGSAENSCGCSTPNQRLQIHCQADNCTYNESGCCNAENIEVGGCSDASCKTETKCKTFKMK
ncbi:MAG: DUF1540 domain-containing protein [Oscillospiraceae bacterium]|nr:DUF1540 domain-containing protein [Oscillospiraceae bacterium]